ncbi:DNA repair endonuclease XPF isoform X2 [Anabrus simplex]|uniref:DNA repair endonuclease XPF isoform X2 n=1 Tax=Anabrus simplex TaxID=316456 RepID=UPI0035A29344
MAAPGMCRHDEGGLSVETVFLNLVKVYSDPGNLVLVLGTRGKEEEYFLSRLLDEGVKPLPKVITTEYSSAEREIVYLEGGVLFVSPRILVVDLLKNRVPIANITGFLVYRAHGILESCQEAFAIRLFRQKNKTGFVKAFSSSPQSFTRGFAQVQHIMKTLFVCNLYLWPRFHATVKSSLEKKKLVVTELHINMSGAMLQIQAAILDLIQFSVKELKQINPSLDLEDVTVENAISKTFHKVLQLQLDPIWHQLSSKTKQLLADLRTLRTMLCYLTRYDCITFHNLVSGFRGMDYALKCSGWLLLDAAETLFLVAKQRTSGTPKNGKEGEVEPEPCPKWKVLSEVLEEINLIAQKDPSRTEKVLILVEDKRTCDQLKQYLLMGARNLLLHLYEKIFKCRVPHKNTIAAAAEVNEDEPEPINEDNTVEVKNEPEDDDALQDRYMLSQKPRSDSGDTEECEDMKIELSQYEEIKEESQLPEVEQMKGHPPIIILQPAKKNDDPLALTKTLNELKPRFVVMYDVDMTAVRRLEVFNSLHPEIHLQVFFLIYGGSVEEQAYLTMLRREKEAFEFLIREKAQMVVHADQAGLTDDHPDLARDSSKPSETVNTRKGGKLQPSPSKTESKIIVDMREFRSELPALIHKRGIEIEPVTLQVGDYILTPDICVERKSVSDLIGSLNSGRLYTQALAMTRHYAKPMLLIEFDQRKPFVLQGQYYVSKNVSSSDVTAKLQLLTLHFPRLRLVWSPSPYATAELFQELKQGQREPDATAAASIGDDLKPEIDFSEKFNPAIQDFMTKLPGVSSKNLQQLLVKCQNLDHLLSLTKEKLSEILGNSTQAQIIYEGLHNVHQIEEDPGPSSSASWKNKKSKGRGGFRRFKT